ncbi:MAG TPA: redoxin family protein [Saprospiraceae bacterium]|nr:redoxin family protein [Candidatus Parvibacillus calidus]WKZ61945.1 MAG: redoxin family protein [Saprospiraceae bacterium]HRN35068.1 redoxin family protein [Saprospiraceae bacterium]HRP85321.1 redoxin family protein [Saprospiraceae bacterium]
MKKAVLFILFSCMVGVQTFACYHSSAATKNKDLPPDSLYMYVFVSETCPICQHMTLQLRDLLKKYPAAMCTLVFPNYTVSDSNSVEKFLNKYKLNCNFTIDYDQKLTREWGVTITPEVLIFSGDQECIYRGKLNNQFARLGERRTVITEHYAEDAIQSYLTGQPIKINKTEPTGCFIIKS